MRAVMFFPKARWAPRARATKAAARESSGRSRSRPSYSASDHIAALFEQIADMETELLHLRLRGAKSGSSRARSMTLLASVLLFKQNYRSLTGVWLPQRSSAPTGPAWALGCVEETEEEHLPEVYFDEVAMGAMRKAAAVQEMAAFVRRRCVRQMAGGWSRWRSFVQGSQKADLLEATRMLSLMRASCVLPRTQSLAADKSRAAPSRGPMCIPRPVLSSRYSMPASSSYEDDTESEFDSGGSYGA